MIKENLLMNFSQKDIDKMCQTQEQIEASATIVLGKIKGSDRKLYQELQNFTPHESCQLSLIRDFLTERRNQLRSVPELANA